MSLYQINCQLPESAPAGDLTLVIAQDKWQANSAKLLVARGGNFDPLLHEE